MLNYKAGNKQRNTQWLNELPTSYHFNTSFSVINKKKKLNAQFFFPKITTTTTKNNEVMKYTMANV